MRTIGTLTLCLLTAGCAAPAVIADIEHDKVVVQSNQYTPPAEVVAEAERGCAIHGRKAEPISTRTAGSDGWAEIQMHLFACKLPSTASPDPK